MATGFYSSWSNRIWLQYGLPAILVLFFLNTLGAQAEYDEGTVSYSTSVHIYVKFASTNGINIGDTLFVKKGNEIVPALQVTNKSSTSCVGTRLSNTDLKKSDKVLAKRIPTAPEKKAEEKEQTTTAPPGQPPANRKDSYEAVQPNIRIKQQVRARLSAASYSTLSDRGNTTRMRYACSFHGDHLNNSKFSSDVYITFRHTLQDWDAVQNNLFDALKIYALSATYDFNESTRLTAGRAINPKIANLGAVDGLQFEKGLGHFYTGAIAGARPDLLDYSFDPNLLQAGAYVGITSQANERQHQTTLGIVEQRNKSAIDRRFVYFQHSDELLKNLNLFGSMELDLYQFVNNEVKNSPSLTNLYVSLRYRFSKKISLSASYDNRKNIIYYESYKSFIDQLIEQETRQGLRAGLNLRPAKWLNCGINASWRFQKSKANDAKNLNAYLNFNQIPILKAGASLTANLLQSGYIEGRTVRLGLTKDLLKGNVNLELYYRRADYTFPVFDYSANQNIVGGSISWYIRKKLGLYLYLENTFDSQGNNYLLVNTKIMQRF